MKKSQEMKDLEELAENYEGNITINIVKEEGPFTKGYDSLKSRLSTFRNDVSGRDYSSGFLDAVGGVVAFFPSLAASDAVCELARAGINKLTGGTNESLSFNEVFKNDYMTNMFTEISFGDEGILTAVNTEIANYGSFLGEMATELLPFGMTASGFYLIAKAREKESPTLQGLGGGIVINHIFDGFFAMTGVAKSGIEKALYALAPPSTMSSPDTYDLSLSVVAFLPALYIGCKAMCKSYDISKSIGEKLAYKPKE